MSSPQVPLQNTSPNIDPAEVSQSQAAFAYQSEMLTGYQEQLVCLGNANDNLIQYIRSLPAPQSSPVRLALPDKFDGSPELCSFASVRFFSPVSPEPMIKKPRNVQC